MLSYLNLVLIISAIWLVGAVMITLLLVTTRGDFKRNIVLPEILLASVFWFILVPALIIKILLNGFNEVE